MPGYLESERNKIIEARKAQPTAPAKTLAKELKAGGGLDGRPFYSVYSVIRRYDAKVKAAVAAAKKAAKNATLAASY